MDSVLPIFLLSIGYPARPGSELSPNSVLVSHVLWSVDARDEGKRNRRLSIASHTNNPVNQGPLISFFRIRSLSRQFVVHFFKFDVVAGASETGRPDSALI